MGLKLKSTGGTGSVELKAPDNHNPDTTITLPADNVTGGEFVLADGSGNVNIDSGTLYVDAVNDRVGVGTAVPDEPLHITASDPAIKLQDSDGTDQYSIIKNAGGDSVYDAVSGTGVGGDHIFRAPTGSANEHVRITSSGNVGIGETSPSAGLHVVTDVNPVLKLDRGSANTANANWYYNGTLTGQISAANADFQVSAAGASTPISFFANGSERMRITSDGSVALGTINDTASPIDVDSRVYYYSNNASTSGQLFIDSRRSSAFISVNQSYADTGNRGAIAFYRSEAYKGQISISSTQVYYNTTSDYRLKENVADVTGGIDLVKQLQPRSFNFINEPSETIMGFVAHEVQDVVPNAVSGTKDGLQVWEEGEELPDGLSVGDNKLDENGDTIPDYQCLDQAKLVPVLTAALKEAIAKIETLEANNVSLEAKVTALETQNASFEARLAALEGGTTE